MGLFSKPKPNPKIIVEGIEIGFDLKHDIWSFKLRDIEFMAVENLFKLPAKPELETILAEIEALKPEMRSRLAKELAGWPNSKLDTGESYLVDITEFGQDRSFRVCWSNDPKWGDMGRLHH